jgi:hypothetical protein
MAAPAVGEQGSEETGKFLKEPVDTPEAGE